MDALFDVLLYLFESYFYDDSHVGRDRESLQAETIQAGFSQSEVVKAFDWLDGVAAQRIELDRAHARRAADSVRVYSAQEAERLDVECRDFLMFLCRTGMLDAQQHECVVDRAMALDMDSIDLDDLKWVVLLVLFSQPDQEAAYVWMETYLFDDEAARLN